MNPNNPLHILEWVYQVRPAIGEGLLTLLRPSERMVLCDIEGMNPERAMYRIKSIARRLRLSETQVRALSKSARRKIRTATFIERLNEAVGRVQEELEARRA